MKAMQLESTRAQAPFDWFQFLPPETVNLNGIEPSNLDGQVLGHFTHFGRQDYYADSLPLFGYQLRALVELERWQEIDQYYSFTLRDGALGLLHFFQWFKENCGRFKGKRILVQESLITLAPEFSDIEIRPFKLITHQSPSYLSPQHQRQCIWINLCLMPTVHNWGQIERELVVLKGFCKDQDIKEIFLTFNTLTHFFVYKPEFYDFFTLSYKMAQVFDFKIHPTALGTGLSLPSFSNYYYYQNQNNLVICDDYTLHHVANLDGKIIGVADESFKLGEDDNGLVPISPKHSIQVLAPSKKPCQFESINSFYRKLMEKREFLGRSAPQKWDQKFNFFLQKILLPTIQRRGHDHGPIKFH